MTTETTGPNPGAVDDDIVVLDGTDPATPPAAATPPPDARGDVVVTAIRTFGGLLANVTVVTALLVYFGWRRSETQAQRLGVDESILGMSTRDYVIRSIGPVLALLIGVAVAGLAWVWLDRHLVKWVATRRRDRGSTLVLFVLSVAWFVLPVVVVALGYVWRPGAYVLFPASIGAGVLLMLYGGRLRQQLYGTQRPNQALTQAFVAVIVAACLFWTASNYAEVLGNSLADSFSRNVDRRTGVVVYSERRLYIDAPGAAESKLAADEEAYRYRYTGLRLLEHTGGTYFLISDQWSPRYGVVIALKDADNGLRLEFVRDRR